MADITISSGDYIRPYRCPWGQPEMRSGPESTAQTFKYGDVVELDLGVSTGANRIRQASTSGSTITSTAIVGVAAQPASSVVEQKVSYYSAAPANEFWARSRGGTLALATVGASFGLFRDSSKNVTLIDLGNTQSTSLRVIVTELVDAVGDSGGAVIFKFGCPNGSTNTFGLAITR
jgi:hypothetical protein